MEIATLVISLTAAALAIVAVVVAVRGRRG